MPETQPRKVSSRTCEVGTVYRDEWVFYVDGLDEHGKPFTMCPLCLGWHDSTTEVPSLQDPAIRARFEAHPINDQQPIITGFEPGGWRETLFVFGICFGVLGVGYLFACLVAAWKG